MNIYRIINLLLLLWLQLPAFQTAAQSSGTITISNPLDRERTDELVVLKRKEVEKKTGIIPEGKYLSVTAKNFQEIMVQHDDLNGDGKWDEAVFLFSFQAKEIAAFRIRQISAKSGTGTQHRAHVRLKKKNPDNTFGPNLKREEMPLRNPATDFSKQPLPLYLTEGPAWENDKVAFRLYFDMRNGKDIFGKRTPRMVSDSVGVVVHPSYHDLNDWGMDVLHAGKSLGSGALALSVPQAGGEDTLIRLGGENVKKTVYEQITDGPVRAVFRIAYDWEIDGKPVRISEESSIWGGQYFYESRVLVSGAPQGSKLVAGIASFYDNIFRSFTAGGAEVFLSHGKQSENKDNLGMAVMVPREQFSFAGSAPNANSEILNTYLVAQEIQPGKACIYRFYAGWEKTDSRFASLNYFKNFLKNEAQKISKPLLW